MNVSLNNCKPAIIGLGYVGLPLAVEFSRHFPVLGFDISAQRVDELQEAFDRTLEVESSVLKEVLNIGNGKGLVVSARQEDLATCNIYVVTVPTPVDESKRPDLSPLISASRMLGQYLKKGDIVIYESTTYPGCTEEDCVPELEKISGLVFNQDFFCGYSPERINPGDKQNTLVSIKKVTSGSTPEIADFVDAFYQTIITAGTFKASSIKVAEASKAIENAQRDVNISFVNELALIFDRLGIDTQEVLKAAGTKWNFLPYKPGLVGGHCIGVDPYYLAYKAEQVGYHPAVILSGRRVNDQMGSFVANKVIKLMIAKGINVKGSKVLILGITFKENCPDIRNTRIVDIRQELLEFGCQVDIADPWADPVEVKHEFGFELKAGLESLTLSNYQAIILGVAHEQFKALNLQSSEQVVVFDVKGILELSQVDARL